MKIADIFKAFRKKEQVLPEETEGEEKTEPSIGSESEEEALQEGIGDYELRDPLGDADKLKSAIEFNQEYCQEEVEKIRQLEEDEKKGIQRYPRENPLIIFDTKASIFRNRCEIVRAKYSLGMDCESLEQEYEEMVWAASEVGFKKIGYVHVLEAFTFGILLEVPKDKLEALVKSVDEQGMDDCLFDFFVEAYGLKRAMVSTGYQKENPYKGTARIIELARTDKEAASKELENYMNKKWFQGHYDYGWKNAHKEHGYYGFWSFDTAALAKLLQLDDSCLKGNNHYPYDLAHYKQNIICKTADIPQISSTQTQPQKQDVDETEIEENRELEQIVPNEFRDLINQVIKDYNNLSDTEFWTKYSLGDIWYTVDEYIKENADRRLLGNIIVNVLAEKDYILQLDYKEDIDEYISNMKNYWQEQDVKLVRFELGNDQYYYAFVPKASELDKVYEVEVIQENVEIGSDETE